MKITGKMSFHCMKSFYFPKPSRLSFGEFKKTRKPEIYLIFFLHAGLKNHVLIAYLWEIFELFKRLFVCLLIMHLATFSIYI